MRMMMIRACLSLIIAVVVKTLLRHTLIGQPPSHCIRKRGA